MYGDGFLPSASVTMTTPLKIDFVSDVSCPWCVIGLRALEQALEALGDEVQAQIHFQPFELNPNMVAEGQEIQEHIAEKYGSTPEQVKDIHENIRARGAELGFVFTQGERRIYNTFDAHRLLHWAGLEGKQQALKQALFDAYFTDLADPSSQQTLASVAQKVGLDRLRAEAILASGDYAAEVREAEQLWISRGVSSVPTIVFNDEYAVSGGQPVDVFVGAIRQILNERTA
ncbi:2-hydroxychromene-2-carboxylate isomerase [Pseudomonas cichorii]|uniref:2-hydroxychromene-2-carboxylate isomerase n=2 Tax=Pseudomonas cichorii TaxID=36746 RepID=A0A3M4M799_PSECI|nr:2-hydroxychromene-2-carboxylate isomerase [Pseudomonas cichorii]